MTQAFDEDSTARLVDLFQRFPEKQEEILAGMRARGIDPSQIGEMLPFNVEAEAGEMGKGLMEGLSFGALDQGQPDIRAGDVDLPFFGEVSPSRFAGNVAGSLPFGIGSYMTAGKLAAKAGLTGTGAKVATHVGGEALPGAAEGLVSSRGDLAEAGRHAAIWTSVGLMGEGTFQMLGKALKRAGKGLPLTSPQKRAVTEYEKIKARVTDKLDAEVEKYKPEWYKKFQESADPDVSEYPMAPPSVVASARGASGPVYMGVALGRFNIAEGMEKMDEILKARLSGLPEARQVEIRAAMTDANKRILDKLNEGSFSPNEAQDELESILSGKGSIFDMAERDLSNVRAKVGDKKPKLEKFVDDENARAVPLQPLTEADQAAVDDALSALSQGRTKRGGQADQTDFSIDEDAGVSADGEPLSRRTSDQPVDSEGNILPAETEVGITEQQAARIHDLENKIEAEGFEVPEADKLSADMNSGEARVRRAELTDLLNRIQGRNHKRALRDVLQEEIDPRMLKDPFDIEEGLDPAKMSRAQRAQWNMTKEQRPARDGSDLHTSREPQVTVFTDPDDDLIELRTPGLPWYLQILPPSSRWGLGANPRTKTRLVDTLDNLELISRDTHSYLKRMQEAFKSFQPKMQDRIGALLDRPTGRGAVETSATLKRSLMRALDSDAATANRILTEEGQSVLVPAYTEIRGILDELADRLNLEPGQRITQYFPHVFDGQSGSWRANRVLMELGGRGRAIEGLMPAGEGVTGLPKNRRFGNVLERKGSERENFTNDYNEDLEAVLYTYIRGAVDKQYMDPLIGRVQKTIDSLPRKDQNGKKLYNHEELQRWFGYVMGQPTRWKHIQAQWWRNNEAFNRWTDKAVEWLGNAEEKGLMEQARKGRVGPDGQRIPYSKQEERQVIEFFDKLVRDADNFESYPGSERKHLKDSSKTMQKYRARLALMVDDIRAGLSDPAGKPILLEKLYGLMVVNKLGLSVSHGIMNGTQTLTNTVPTLGLRYTTRGVKHYVERENPIAEIGGRKVSDIIEESGIKADFPEAKEFIPEGLGLWKDVDNIAMTPATLSEEFNRTVALMGQYEKSIVEEGLDHAHALAKARQLVRKTQFSFNRGGTPPILQGPLARFLLMFKSYTMHQTNFSAELLEDAIKGNPGPFMKHMLGYLTMAGVGATVLGEPGADTNFGDRSGHPLMDLVPSQGRSVGETVGGPPSSALIEALHGQYSAAFDEVFTPTASKRAERAIEQGDPMEALGLR